MHSCVDYVLANETKIASVVAALSLSCCIFLAVVDLSQKVHIHPILRTLFGSLSFLVTMVHIVLELIVKCKESPAEAPRGVANHIVSAIVDSYKIRKSAVDTQAQAQ